MRKHVEKKICGDKIYACSYTGHIKVLTQKVSFGVNISVTPIQWRI